VSDRCCAPKDGARVWRTSESIHIDVRVVETPEPMIVILRLIDGGEVNTALIAALVGRRFSARSRVSEIEADTALDFDSKRSAADGASVRSRLPGHPVDLGQKARVQVVGAGAG